MEAIIALVKTLSINSPISSPVPQKSQKHFSWDALDDELKPHGLKSYETGAQGNCQYHVIAFLLNQYGIGKSHTLVRQEVCDEMTIHSELYREFVPTTNGEDAGTSYAAFVNRQSMDGEWGEHVTLQAACNVYGLTLKMFCPHECTVHFKPNTWSTNTSPCMHGNIAFLPEIHYRATVNADMGSGVIKPKAVVSVPPSTLVGWECTECTLVNRHGASKCKACSAWKCVKCTVVNRDGTAKCHVCSADPHTA